MKNFKDEPWTEYGREFKHLMIDIDDVEDSDLLIELPRAVQFMDEGLRPSRPGQSTEGHATENHEDPAAAAKATRLEESMKSMMLGSETPSKRNEGGVFVHCAAGKSRSVAVVVAYLLWRFPKQFDPGAAEAAAASSVSRRATAKEAVAQALTLVRRTRPMADPNDGFIQQLELWWEMGCPAEGDMEDQPAYQRWAYKREVEENVAVGQAPARLRFEDEERQRQGQQQSTGLSLRCKKCRRTLATGPFLVDHTPLVPTTHTSSNSSSNTASEGSSGCQHVFLEPLGWMRAELEKGLLSGRLLCPNARCGAGVGRYDWKGLRCSCGGWVTPGFSLQRSRVDEVKALAAPVSPSSSVAATPGEGRGMGIRHPPAARRTSHV